MIKSTKLSEIIGGLTPNEVKDLGEFLSSPFHNKNKNILRLYELISHDVQSFMEKDREKISSIIYPDEAYNDQKFRTLVSDFTNLLEKFILYLEIKKNPLLEKNFLLRSLQERNLTKSFNLVFNELDRTLNKEFSRNEDYYLNRFNADTMEVTQKGMNLDSNLDSDYDKLSSELDMMFILHKLKNINSYLSRKYQVFGNIQLNKWGSNETISFVQTNLEKIKKEHPVIYSEYLILMMMLHPAKKQFFMKLKSYTFTNINKINFPELEQIYYPLCNYCFNKIAVGEINYLESLFEIYKKFEKSGFYSRKKSFQYSDFTSVIITYVRLKKTDRAEKFLKKYKDKITDEFRTDTINLSEALISFTKKRFNESLSYLNKVSYSNTYFYMKSKEILIQIYYETNQTEPLLPLIDAVKHYLKRHKDILTIHTNRYLSFLNYTNKLININNDKSELRVLKKEATKNISVIGRDWLLEKINEKLKT